MKLDVRNDKDFLKAIEMTVYDKKTGREIPYIVAGDDSTGQIVQYKLKNGKPYVENGDVPIVSYLTDFEFVKI